MPHRPRVLLSQLPIPPAGPEPIRGNVPLAAGYMKLAAGRRLPGAAHAIEVLPAREANTLGDEGLLQACLEREPELLGFTTYLWNIDRTLWLGREVRRRRPETRIILGGPEITPDNAWVLDEGPQDFAAVGEGEATLPELLERLAGGTDSFDGIPGLIHGRGGARRHNGPRAPLASLDPISSPYLDGILDAADGEQLLLETVRGCIFKCKFCYYPKAYDDLYFVSREKILANLAHARDRGAREVYILDPTLNQRRDFIPFLEVLRAGNSGGALELHAELRAEGVTPASARLMREAGFKEVEIGLQSIDPAAQRLMDRTNSLKAFEKGVRALQAEGIRVRVDLIVGLPGDTVESVRRGMHYLATHRLYDDIQVFQLSILPGTSFRQEAAALGLEYQPRPPYYVLRTPTLDLEAMLGLLEEAEDIFETQFDAQPPPALDLPADGSRALVVDLDREAHPAPPQAPAQAFTLWLKARNPYARLPVAERLVRELLAANPFTTLQIVLETAADVPLDVFRRLTAACARPVSLYLDRFHAFTPGRKAASQRCVIVLPAGTQATIGPEWIDDATAEADVVWAEPAAPGDRSTLEPADELEGRPGEWRWRPAAAVTSTCS